MKEKIQRKLNYWSSIIEIVIGIFVLLACVIGGIGVVINTDISSMISSPEYFIEWLNIICYFVIGVEFVKMIASHSVDSVVDVLLVALSRQMLVDHPSPFNALFIILAVAILFVVRKYLYISKIDKRLESERVEKETNVGV